MGRHGLWHAYATLIGFSRQSYKVILEVKKQSNSIILRAWRQSDDVTLCFRRQGNDIVLKAIRWETTSKPGGGAMIPFSRSGGKDIIVDLRRQAMMPSSKS